MCGYVVLGPYNVKVSEHYVSIYFTNPVSLLSFVKNDGNLPNTLYHGRYTRK